MKVSHDFALLFENRSRVYASLVCQDSARHAWYRLYSRVALVTSHWIQALRSIPTTRKKPTRQLGTWHGNSSGAVNAPYSLSTTAILARTANLPAFARVMQATSACYAADAGRHSGTYASTGLEKGLPALKLILKSAPELDDVVAFIKAFAAKAALPTVSAAAPPSVRSEACDESVPIPVDLKSMPAPKPVAPRREAIPRAVQREVWQRDGGACVECGSRKLLCFDHIVPFSLGGSNTVRNLQLLCEPCNLSKSNRI